MRAPILYTVLVLLHFSAAQYASYSSNAELLDRVSALDCSMRVQVDLIHDLYPSLRPDFNLTRIILHDHPEGVYPTHRFLVVCGLGALDLVAQEVCLSLMERLCNGTSALGGDALAAFVLVPNPVGRARALAQYASVLADPTFSYEAGRYNGSLSAEQLCDDSTRRGVDIDRNFPSVGDDQRHPLGYSLLGRSYLPFSEVEARIVSYVVSIVRPTTLFKLETGDYYGAAMPLDRGHSVLSPPLEASKAALQAALAPLMPDSASAYAYGADARRSGPKAGTLGDWAFDAMDVPRVASFSVYDYAGAFGSAGAPCIFRRVPFRTAQLSAAVGRWAPTVFAAFSAAESL